MHKKHFFFFAFILISFTACQKEGIFQEELQYADVTVSWAYNPNPGVPYAVELNGLELTDSLIYTDPDRNNAFKRFALNGNSGRLVIKEGKNKQVILDTMITFLTNRNSFRLLQLVKGGKPLITAGDNAAEADPETRDITKLQLIYVNPELPDSIRVNFYAFNMATWELDNPYMHSYLLKRGEFSDYKSFKFKYGLDMAFFLEVMDAKTDVVLQAYDVNTFDGFVNSIFNNSGRPEPEMKLVTGIIEFAGDNDPVGYPPGVVYDNALFFSRW